TFLLSVFSVFSAFTLRSGGSSLRVRVDVAQLRLFLLMLKTDEENRDHSEGHERVDRGENQRKLARTAPGTSGGSRCCFDLFFCGCRGHNSEKPSTCIDIVQRKCHASKPRSGLKLQRRPRK